MANQTDAQKRAHKNYMEKFSRVEVRIPYEKRERVQSHAERQGESVNGFINRAIEETMERDNGENPVGNIRAEGAAFLSPDTLERARASAEKNGEDISRFIGRAVESAIERPAGEVTLSLPPMILELAQARADAAGESLQSYFIRALQERMRREKDAEE